MPLEKKEVKANHINKLHFFTQNINGVTPPLMFTYPFHYTPHPLVKMAAENVQSYLSSRTEWKDELHQGKMFGVLIVRTHNQEIGYLAAFSGNLAGSNHHHFFVPPIYDLLQPNGFFRIEEAQISKINQQVFLLENDPEYLKQKEDFLHLQHTLNQKLTAEKANLKIAKQQREERRIQGVSEIEEQKLIKESQFLKAEYKRLERKIKEVLTISAVAIEEKEKVIKVLKEERKQRSSILQKQLFEQFQIKNALGETKNLCQIFKSTPQGTPPAGAGECALPKLLQYAYLNQLYPLAMGEFWWGMSPKEEIRHHGHFYPSCKGKCEPILKHMLTGLQVEKNPLAEDSFQNVELEIIYEDEWIVAVNKPAGMLSVPGKNDLDSVFHRLQKRYPQATGPLIIHRLDMATSGILLAAKTKEVHQAMQTLFISRQIHKQYTAILKGYQGPNNGYIDLPLMPDWNNRPRQMVSRKHGKPALTEFHIIKTENEYTWVNLYPHTGRTHQLRVHAAHPEGMNAPILGDELYGNKDKRLYLHASSISFIHPVTHQHIQINNTADF